MDTAGFWSKTLLFTEFLAATLTVSLSADRATQLVHGMWWAWSTPFILLKIASAVQQSPPVVKPMSRNQWIMPWSSLTHVQDTSKIWVCRVFCQSHWAPVPHITVGLDVIYCIYIGAVSRQPLGMYYHTHLYRWTHQWLKYCGWLWSQKLALEASNGSIYNYTGPLSQQMLSNIDHLCFQLGHLPGP